MPSEQITIAGQAFAVPMRYEEGHELTAGEASALNQTFHENIRNNLAKAAKEGKLTQEEVDKYAADYQFGVRTGGGGERDPVKSEAMRIAKSKITQAIKASGGKVGDIETSALNDAARALVEQDPAITDLARQRVEEQQKLATGDLSALVASLKAKAPATADAPEAQ